MKTIKRLFILLLCIFVLSFVGCEYLPIDIGNINDGEKEHKHTVVEHKGKEPTCTEIGWSPYETCSECDEYTTYSEIAALGHEYAGEPVIDSEFHTYACVRCNKSAEPQPHSWKQIYSVTPSCDDEGALIYMCTACQTIKTDSVPKNEHNYSDTYKPNGNVHSLFCADCSASIDQPHVWTDATCYTPQTCNVCGATEGEALNHAGAEWKVRKEATATVDGTKVLLCELCDSVVEERVIPCDAKSMPVIYLEGDYTAATAKKNEVQMTVSYVDPDGETSFEGYALIKVQGASSTAYAKKNYTIKFYKDSECDKKLKVDLGWGNESKYVMKANWVDYLQARNIVACRLWGDMVISRPASSTQERLAALSTNGGAIDGYPIAVYMNGEFYGLYTMNVPKDDWMFGMGDSETEAILGADDWVNTDFSVLIEGFVENSAGDLVSNGTGWELKYYGTEDTTGDTEWVTKSFNNLILFCQQNDGEAFKSGISEHLDVDAAIDYLILMYAIYMRDNTSKNMIWATYDGKVWIPSVYDQDGTFGQVWDGKRPAPATSALPFISDGVIDVNMKLGNGYFLLWDRIWNNFTDEVLQRYWELRESTLSKENIIAEFEAFRACIPESIYEADCEYWAEERAEWWQGNSGLWYEKYDYDYTYKWISDRLDALDAAMQEIYSGNLI